MPAPKLRRYRPRCYSRFCVFGWHLGATSTVCAQEAPAYSRELPKVQTGAAILEFNGKDLSGFYTYLHDSKYDDPKKVFSVRDGLLEISGEEFGGLTTHEEYHDYVLIAEWKWGERTFGSRKTKRA